MFQSYRHVHFVGIAGIGMSALAKWFLHEGIKVSGSDLSINATTQDLRKRGVTFFSGHAVSNIAEDIDLLIYTSAIPEHNIERQHAQERGISQKSYFETLGEISKSFSTIVITGTNGKSTTTAILGLLLEAAGYDPTVLVGSLVPGFKDGNLRLGKGRFFVVEGCEYRANMMNLDPEMIVLTNIEEDHLDYYRDLNHIQQTFQAFVDKLQGKGMVVYNAMDPGTAALHFSRSVGYGFEKETDYFARQRTVSQGAQQVSVYRHETDELYLGDLKLQIPGEFNVMNALAAISAAMELGIPFETCCRVLEQFKGIWRRFERVGVWRGADVISDYGHHPTAIAQTVQAAREFFPGRRILLCYQPHQHDRTKKLFDEFVETLALADHVIVVEIYDVAGRNEEHNVSSNDLVLAIKKKDSAKDIMYAEDFVAAENLLCDVVQSNDVLLIMGAGDIDSLARKLV
ncbi:MAG: UDP-N-acetylmuramate-L-alanine ligase [Candidatus Uhrbacteria bacterium GW2011_GWF2_39_13]|uniref:UDP-N-acetylmuramate--L-alanine ligase n=1 Tax=Candidatus Uhrbacteria bacterium GW2011_GWF2_39_13 TaxID=1618995 RepID=A0A0G0MMY9_9BACT|nr:MAG: UDP-N-acetylmuramate-L-alanine ligase [Candidatus Uhrbacteria bacterium GW2011_GWF2_39_13]HAU65748.1 UDP-N-acetylmuramate--L-alanine ligase [Candidatus Uhrbacteria bacterium]